MMRLLNPRIADRLHRLLRKHTTRGSQCSIFARSGSTSSHKEPTEVVSSENPWANVKVVEHRKATWDDFPIPQGSWQEYYDQRQRSNNLQLGLGVAFFGGTLYYIWRNDPFNFEKVFGPYKYMKNPPAFESPVLEPNVLLLAQQELLKSGPISESSTQTQSAGTGSTNVARDKSSVSTASSGKEKDLAHVDLNKMPDIPNHVPFLIVGGGTAAFAAYRSIRANNPKAAVLVVTEEDFVPYMRPPLTKELWFSDSEQIKKYKFKPFTGGKERSVFFEPPEFYVEPKSLSVAENGGVAVVKNHKVIRIDPVHQKVQLDNGWEIFYDRCLLATGARPRSLPALESAGRDVMSRVTLFRGLKDFVNLADTLKDVKRVAVVGGGFLGSELACALSRRGKASNMEVFQIFPEKGHLGRILPEYLSSWLTQKVRTVDGVEVHSETFVKRSEFSNGVVILHLSNGEQVQVDHVVVAVGVTPNTELALSGQLETDEVVGGFKVNSELEAHKNLWVAGDAASFFDVVLGRRRIEHHDHAIATGRLAGENMLGKAKPFLHQSMFWSDIGPEVGFEAVGLIDSSLETVGVFAKPTNGASNEKPTASASDAQPAYTNLEVPDPSANYSKGVIFYLKDKIVVGVLLWNLFNHVTVARKIIKEQRNYSDLSEVAKLFNLHENEEAEGSQEPGTPQNKPSKDDDKPPQEKS